MMKERFTSCELKSISLLTVSIFYYIADADGDIDEQEYLNNAYSLCEGDYEDDLHREIVKSLTRGDMKEFKNAMDDLKTILIDINKFDHECKMMLKSKLTEVEYQSFIASLFVSGVNVAKSSGGGVLGLGNPVSKKEKANLLEFAKIFELDQVVVDQYF